MTKELVKARVTHLQTAILGYLPVQSRVVVGWRKKGLPMLKSNMTHSFVHSLLS